MFKRNWTKKFGKSEIFTMATELSAKSVSKLLIAVLIETL